MTNEKHLDRILCVDDDSDILVVMQMSLSAVGGFTVQCCSSGLDALEMAPAFAPDLILLDVMMPGMDGQRTLRLLRERPSSRSVPVVFITAKVQLHEVEQLQALGTLGVLTKPFDPLRLPGQLRRLWETAPRTGGSHAV